MNAPTRLMTLWAGTILFVMTIAGCDSKKQQADTIDKPNKGTIHISVDESYRPVIEEQIAMYEASNPETRIIADYKTEEACIRDFFRDSATRMVLITRGLRYNEESYMKDSLKYPPRWGLLAADAIAVISNRNNPDSMFTLDELRDRLLGKLKREQTIVFDGLSATSTFRFIRDSILKGAQPDSSVVKAAKTSQEVIDFISENPNAIGLVGISWVGNPEVREQVERLQKIRINYLRCDICPDQPFVKPVQESIQTRRYPLVRGLYYVIKENYHGLGNGFVDFLKYERGQLIFRRAYLAPIMNFDVRPVKINLSIPKK